MPVICPRCGRPHSGACGIPSNGVRVGAGATAVRAVGARTLVPDSYPISVGPVKPKQSTQLTKRVLHELLNWGVEQERKTVEMLRVLPSEMPEYEQLLEHLDKVIETNRQVRVQIALRKNRI
ncbi:MAG: hypothetical protein AMJ37_02550 [Dehalococcoidia bacterium DG_18]|nr:MAG: hypothetical protein AMJ37_02550 [Dehalococcoidia bacterium DG_18]